MIAVTRRQGEVSYLNPDLIESIDATPDTVITLVDGKKIHVREKPTDIIGAITVWRASILAVTAQISAPDPGERF